MSVLKWSKLSQIVWRLIGLTESQCSVVLWYGHLYQCSGIRQISAQSTSPVGPVLMISSLHSNLILVVALVPHSQYRSVCQHFLPKLSFQCMAAEIKYIQILQQSCSKLGWSFCHHTSFQSLFKSINISEWLNLYCIFFPLFPCIILKELIIGGDSLFLVIIIDLRHLQIWTSPSTSQLTLQSGAIFTELHYLSTKTELNCATFKYSFLSIN